VAAIFDRWCLLPRASIPFNCCVRRIFSCRSLPLSPHSAHALHQGAWLLLFVSYRMQCIRCADHRVAGSSRDPLWPPVPRFHLLPCFKYLSCLSRRAFIRAAVGQMEAGRTVVGTGRREAERTTRTVRGLRFVLYSNSNVSIRGNATTQRRCGVSEAKRGEGEGEGEGSRPCLAQVFGMNPDGKKQRECVDVSPSSPRRKPEQLMEWLATGNRERISCGLQN